MQVTDPVCGMTLDSASALAKEAWQGETYYLCSESCHTLFTAAPERYAKRNFNSLRSSEESRK